MFFFFQAEDGIRDLVRSRGLGDVYKRQELDGRELIDLVGRAHHQVAAGVGVEGLAAEGPGLSLIHI